MGVLWVPKPNAAEEVAKMDGVPQYAVSLGDTIGAAIVSQVPVVQGVVVTTYSPSAAQVEDGARVTGFGSFWHWLEYGNRWVGAYRPIMRGVELTGVRWEPS